MTEKQEKLLILLREVDQICRANGLRYCMAGGSLIGVVRHEGFVPWDDDIDLYMPRDDWDQFVRICEKELPENRVVECRECDPEYTNTFPRYGSSDTCAIHKHQIIGKDRAGEIIDILTLDPIPPGRRKYLRYRTSMMLYSELVNLNSVFCDRWEIPRFRYRWNLLLYRLLGRDKALSRLEKKMFSWKEEKCTRFAMRWGGCPFLFDKDMLFPVKDGMFEGLKVMIPAHTSDYLIWHYGDEWRFIPPHGERESHDTVSPRGMNYQEFRNLYLPSVDTAHFRKEAVRRKLYYLGAARRNHKLISMRQELYGTAVLMDLRARQKEMLGEGQTLKGAMDAQDFSLLDRIFREYFRVQMSAEYIGREDFVNIYRFYHPTVLQLEEEERQAAVMTLLYTERISKADRLIRIWKFRRRKLPEFFSRCLEDIVLFRKCSDLEEAGLFEDALSLAEKLLTDYPGCPSFLKLRLRMMFRTAQSLEDWKQAEDELARCLEKYPEDGYYLKYFGDLLFREDRIREALAVYAYARSRTKDGLIWLEIEKKVRPLMEEDLERYHSLLEMEPLEIIQEEKENPYPAQTQENPSGSRLSFGEFEVLFDPEDLEAKADQCMKDAASLILLWTRLLPEDSFVRSQADLCRAYRASSRGQLLSLAASVERNLRGGSRHVVSRIPPNTDPRLIESAQDTLTVIYARLGYPFPLAAIRAGILVTDDESGQKELSEKLERLSSRGKNQAAVWKLMGDLKLKQGFIKEAFHFYIEALYQADFPFLSSELEDLLLDDLKQGGAKVRKLAPKQDMKDFLDGWLDKYGTLEEIQRLVHRLSGGSGPGIGISTVREGQV